MSHRRPLFHLINTLFVLLLATAAVLLLFITPTTQALWTGIFAAIFLATLFGIWSLAEGLSLDA